MQASPPTPGWEWLPLPGATAGGVRADWAARLAANGLHQFNDFARIQGLPLSKPGLGARYRARLDLATDSGPAVCYLKRWGQDRFQEAWRRFWEDGRPTTPAEREVRAAAGLVAAGITVPGPVAWGRRGPVSFVVLQSAAGDALERWLAQPRFSPDRAGWERRRQLVAALADLARRLHTAGWCHRDLYLCHVFVQETVPALALSLIDLQRVFRPRWRFGRWRVKDLAQLHVSATPFFSPCLQLRFAKLYFGWDKLTPARKELLRRILRKSAAIGKRRP